MDCMEICLTCKYFSDGWILDEDDRCKRYPPVHIGLNEFKYPTVNRGDGCGEWAQKGD